MSLIIPQIKASASQLCSLTPNSVWKDRGERYGHDSLKHSQIDLLTSTVQKLLENPCYTIRHNSRKLLVYVDASDEMLGFSQAPSDGGEIGKSKQALQSAYQASKSLSRGCLKWPIYLKELLAIKIAVQQVPPCTDLLVYSDNQAVIAMVKKSVGPDQVAQEMIDAIVSNCFRREVGLVVQYVNTELNYADYPSRHFIKNPVNSKIFSEANHVRRHLSYENTVNFFAAGSKRRFQGDQMASVYHALQSISSCIHTVFHQAAVILREDKFLSDPKYRFSVKKALIMRKI
jgi:hypothetical protein